MPTATPAPKVLVIDDEPDIRELVAVLLAPRGIEIVKAADWDEGVNALRGHPDIGMVLLDLTLPGTPAAPIDQIQTLSPGTPVVVMSGYASPTAMGLEGEHRPAAFLHKPFRAAVLFSTVQRFVKV